MAVTGLVITTAYGKEAAVACLLEKCPGITTVQTTGEAGKLACVLEAPMLEMETAMKKVVALEGVLAADVALLTCEDEMGEDGNIPCPPHKPRHADKAGGKE